MVNIIAWNMGGLNNPNKQLDIKLFLSKHDVGLVGLMETKVKEENIDMVACNLFGGWEWHTNVEYNNKVRKWVAWKSKDYQVRILDSIEQLIHCRAQQIATQKVFYITFVYGMNSIALREPLWRRLRDIAYQMPLA